jgi:hypothetical protein
MILFTIGTHFVLFFPPIYMAVFDSIRGEMAKFDEMKKIEACFSLSYPNI